MSEQPLSYFLYRLFWSSLDLIFPPECGGCKKPDVRWCEECQKKTKVLSGTLCDLCGLPQLQAGICQTCAEERPLFHALRSWTVFESPVQHALHRLKYKKDIALGDSLAAQMIPYLIDLNWKVDVIVPIPLGKQRMKERGYNQVAMIAKPIALALNIQYEPQGLARCKETRTQVGLSRTERKENIREAFQSPKLFHGKNILIIDDVATTGSTLSAGADALLAAGANLVYAFTVARALPHHGLRHV